MLGRENAAILDRTFAVEYLLGAFCVLNAARASQGIHWSGSLRRRRVCACFLRTCNTVAVCVFGDALLVSASTCCVSVCGGRLSMAAQALGHNGGTMVLDRSHSLISARVLGKPVFLA